VTRLAVLSYHTSPLAQPGTGDSGGMNVYVRELAAALARQGHDVVIYTRRDDPAAREVTAVEPGVRVVRVTAGPARELAKEELLAHVPDFTRGVRAAFARHGLPDALHANYWLSALTGHELKHELDVPLLCTFHTLERVKALTFESPDHVRDEFEATCAQCADAILASCDVERDQIVEHYDVAPERVHIVPLGVDHAVFSPGPSAFARRALGLSRVAELLLFVGRLQELKGVELALETQLALRARGRATHLAIIGGPSGPGGRDTVAALHRRVRDAGAIDAVHFVAPQSHQILSTWYRAADVTLVPSRAESFGLVALESLACATPVLASQVGGLQTLVTDGVNGGLIVTRDAATWADRASALLDAPDLATMKERATHDAQHYTWARAAHALDELVVTLRARRLVECAP
jgi:D-inositol-3-phosphate glycosyltransferase